MEFKDNPILHIYAQPFEHCEPLIVGNTKAIVGLRDALNLALENSSKTAVFEAMVADGEHFKGVVVVNEHINWNQLPEPYTSESSKDRREGLLNLGVFTNLAWE